MGAVSPHGRSVATLWSNLLQGRSAFTPLTLFDATVFRNPLAGVVEGYPAATAAGQPARAVRMVSDAVGEAPRDALGLSADAPEAALLEGISKCGVRHADLVTG